MSNIAALTEKVAVIEQAVTDGAAEISQLADEVKALGTQLAGDADEQAQVDALSARLQAAADKLEGAVTGAQPAPTPGPANPPEQPPTI